jgi:hypothetical protein
MKEWNGGGGSCGERSKILRLSELERPSTIFIS